MTATAVVLAGGKGTRSADPTKAKLGQEVGGKSLMEWHLNLLTDSEITDTFVVAGHLGDQVQSLIDQIDHGRLNITVIQEEEQQGKERQLQVAAEAPDVAHALTGWGLHVREHQQHALVHNVQRTLKGAVHCVVV